MDCRLCLSSRVRKIAGSDERDYYLCLHCKLVAVSPEHFMSRSKEKERYLTHNNGIQYQGYVDFLNKAVKPALEFLTKDMLGLDYGCGHAPTLSKMLEMQGYHCEDYDPYFIKNDLNKNYDFIFSTEVFEHFCTPRYEIEKIVSLLKPGGMLNIMTERWESVDTFGNWYYTRDPSHVAFYHNVTIDYICGEFGFQKTLDDERRVTLLRKVDPLIRC
jgi:hypothetical protein